MTLGSNFTVEVIEDSKLQNILVKHILVDFDVSLGNIYIKFNSKATYILMRLNCRDIVLKVTPPIKDVSKMREIVSNLTQNIEEKNKLG